MPISHRNGPIRLLPIRHRFSLRCNNYGATSKTLDISSYELTVTIDEESVVYQPVVNSVTLPAKTESKIVVFFLVTGDIRTGGATVDLATALEK